MTWSVHDAGSWGVATTDTPADMVNALDLPASWPIDARRALVRRDQWPNLASGPQPPTVTEYSPNTGAAAGGDTLVVTGTGLTGATGITFGGTAGVGFTVGSDTACVVTTPPHAAGLVTCVLLHPLGNVTGVGAFTYA